MVDLRLALLITQALEDKYFRRDKVVVETDILGNVKITEYEKVSNEENDSLCDDINDLENEIEELEDEISDLKYEKEKFERKLEVCETLINTLRENGFELYTSFKNRRYISFPSTIDGLIEIFENEFNDYRKLGLLPVSYKPISKKDEE